MFDDDDLDLAATSKFRHMSPVAAATSGLVHAVAALAVVWQLPPRYVEGADRAMAVTVELVTPPPAEAAAEPQPAPHPVAEPAIALAESPPALDPAKELAPPRPQATLERSVPPAESPPALDPASELAPPPPQATLEQSLPPTEAPPPLASHELARSAPAPAPPPRPPAAPAAAAPPRPVPPPPPAARQASAAREESHRRAQDDYLAQLIRKLPRSLSYPRSHEASAQGVVAARVTVARDGRLLAVGLVKSSGFPDLDRSLLDTIRQATPFAPLPPDVTGNQLSVIVPISYTRTQ